LPAGDCEGNVRRPAGKDNIYANALVIIRNDTNSTDGYSLDATPRSIPLEAESICSFRSRAVPASGLALRAGGARAGPRLRPMSAST